MLRRYHRRWCSRPGNGIPVNNPSEEPGNNSSQIQASRDQVIIKNMESQGTFRAHSTTTASSTDNVNGLTLMKEGCHEEGCGGGGFGGREKLKRHRVEVAAGRVWIPETWGKEKFLKDWIDSSVLDASLMPAGLVSARAALMEEGRRPSTANSHALITSADH